MFPVSVEPRAKIKNTSLQGPSSSSLEVALCRALRRETSSIGLLIIGVAAMAQTKAVIPADKNFILKLKSN